MQNPARPERAAEDRRRASPIEIGGVRVAPGTRETIEIPISVLFDHTPMSLTVQVVHGRRPGPVLLVCGAVHGDEINGVEIIRRLLRLRGLDRLRGTLIAAPVVNAYGFISQSRYLPDRRDLNRSFPGSAKGSLTSQLAHKFATEVVAKCTHGIDLHTGAVHRSNYPQVRGNLADPEVRRLAHIFGVPLILNAKAREGSLRGTAAGQGIPFLVYEGGEALRFDSFAIRAGYRGVVRTMRALEMLAGPRRPLPDEARPVVAETSVWVRAPAGGILRDPAGLGARVERGAVLGTIADPFGTRQLRVECTVDGIVVGRTNLPVVNQGDGLFNIARVSDPDTAAEAMDIFRDDWESETPGT